MNPELIDRIEEAIAPLAEAAGRGAGYAWEVLIRQMVLSGAAFVAGGLVATAVAAVFIVVTRRVFLRWQGTSGSYDREALVFGLVALTFGSLFGLALAVSLLTEGVMRLLNPGYYALEQLARVVGA